MRPAIIFITGGVILALQLVASRIMTPYFGVSLFIWASILSITLLFLALGYVVGGRLTRQWPRERLDFCFQLAPGLSALWLVAAALIYPLTFRHLALWDLVGGSFIACLILLAGPLLVLSALNPLLVALARPAAAGKDDGGSGWVFFVSTIGSVAGVVVTAFLIIPNMSNRDAMVMMAAILSLTGLLRRGEGKLPAGQWRQVVAISAAGLVVAGLLVLRGEGGQVGRSARDDSGNMWTVVETAHSAFGGLKVVDVMPSDPDYAPVRVMLRDGLTQNTMTGDGRSASLFTYAVEQLALGAVAAPRRALVLGLGAGFMPMALAARGIRVEVVEIDSKVVDLARRHFRFRPEVAQVRVEDARTFMRRCDQPYDMVLIDLFNGDGMPEHLVTREFLADVAACLVPGGVLAANTFYAPGNPLSERHLLATLAEVFPQVLFAAKPLEPGAELTNAFVLAGRGPLAVQADAEALPEDLRPAFRHALRQARILDRRDSFIAGLAPLTDEANSWSRLGTELQISFRQQILRAVPAEILVN